MQNRSHNKYFHFTHLRCKHTIFYVLNSLIVFYFLAALCCMLDGGWCLWSDTRVHLGEHEYSHIKECIMCWVPETTCFDVKASLITNNHWSVQVKVFPHRGCRRGSVATLWHTRDSRFAVTSQIVIVSHNTLQTVLQWLHPPIDYSDYGDYGDYTHYSDYSDSWYYYNDIILLVLSLSRYTLQPMHYTQIWGQWVIACCKNLHMNRAR